MLTHLDQKNNPTMVDISSKTTSIRMAKAQTKVQLPSIFRDYLKNDEIHLKKGAVFQTAIIAATMAAKKTSEIIPFCHQIPLDAINCNITIDEDLLITILCTVKTSYKTGVEMEALHAATVAALTIYDMCKALSHEITILETKLMNKTGGKNTILGRPTYGLVLTGGKSQRMQEDKALINFKGKPHAAFIFDILQNYCSETFFSARKDQWKNSALENYPTIDDTDDSAGPVSGMLAAFEKYPDVNWIVVACDLAHFNNSTVEYLLSNAKDDVLATCYKNSVKDFPEALCALYTPKARDAFLQARLAKMSCPVKILRQHKIEMIDQKEGINLANINTKDELQKAKHEIH